MKNFFKVKDFGRQGDIMIRRIKELPKGKEMTQKDGVLARGETTGHAHRIENLAEGELVTIGAGVYLKVTGDKCRIVHDAATGDWDPSSSDHHPIPCTCSLPGCQSPVEFLPRGIYEAPGQREYSPEAIRNVAD